VKIRYGLISADSHIVLDRDAFLRHMPSTWGELIPRVRETEVDGRKVERWFVHGEPPQFGMGGVVNAPAVMGNRDRTVKVYAQRWEEVPAKVYDPLERAEALDEDGVDAEVLFPNDPMRGMFFQWKDPDFELACVRAQNDAEAEWRQASDRFAPLMVLPYLSPIETIVAEVERGARNGHRGINVLGSPTGSRSGSRTSAIRTGTHCGTSVRRWSCPSISMSPPALPCGRCRAGPASGPVRSTRP
jgi:uncharacterized protein